MLPPTVDPRTFQDLVDEAKRRIPQYCPEWTDHNVSDPGVMLVELFAWMTDILLYRLNQVPERDFLQFLDLIGARPRPAVPAQAELLFWLTAPVDGVKVVARGVEVATRQTESSPAIIFTTDEELRIVEPKLRHLILARHVGPGADPHNPNDHYDHEDISERLHSEEPLRAEVFQPIPQEGDAFYLGFAENLGGHVIRLNMECEGLHASNINQDDPPLTWEFYTGDEWAPLLPAREELALLRRLEPDVDMLGHRMDDTRGFNRDGRAIFVVPRTAATGDLAVGDRTLTAFWIRCRAARRHAEDRFYDRSPVLQGVQAESIGGMVDASHAFEITDEVLGRSDGTPGQSFSLLNPPVLPRRRDAEASETLEVATGESSFEPWVEVESFADSGATDPHFALDDLTGEVRLGPRLRASGGEERQFGRVPPEGHMLRFTRYRSGGGSVGNVGRAMLCVPKSASDLSYLKWVANLRPASGGRDRESLEEMKLRGPQLVRTREVAVTRSDFEFLARQASPRVARVRCIAGAHNGSSNGHGLSHVRLVIVPSVSTTDQYVPLAELQPPPEARRALARQIKSYLDERTPLTTEIAVTQPDYRWVSVRVVLAAKPRSSDAAQRERQFAEIRADAERRLYRLLHPASGGPDGEGWPFGKSLTLADVYPVLQSVAGVEYVDEVRFRPVQFPIEGEPEVGAEERLIHLAEGEVLCSYVHEISVVAIQ
jgi:predicted phage baseplate assembly protein